MTAMASRLLPAEVRALQRLVREIPQSLFNRGQSYRRQVPDDLEVEDGLLVCEIQGSARRPYEVTIDFHIEPPGASCTCPYSGEVDDCKHVAAVVAELLAPRSASRSAAPRQTRQVVAVTSEPDPLAGSLARVD